MFSKKSYGLGFTFFRTVSYPSMVGFFYMTTFFDKGNILISKRYWLHPASATTKYQEQVETSRMHTANRIKEEKRKTTPCQSDQRLAAAENNHHHWQHPDSERGSPTATPSRRKRCTSTVVSMGFHPEKVRLISDNAFNKEPVRKPSLSGTTS